MKRLNLVVAAMLFIVVSLSGCSINFGNNEETTQKKQPGPEVGKWYGYVNISDLNLSAEDQTIISLLAGNVAYEMSVEFCEDNTYSYVMNMDKFREEIQKSASTVLGYFISFDIVLSRFHMFDKPNHYNSMVLMFLVFHSQFQMFLLKHFLLIY